MNLYHQWHHAQRRRFAKQSYKCQQVIQREISCGRYNSSLMRRMQRMCAYYRERIWQSHINEQQFYYKGAQIDG